MALWIETGSSRSQLPCLFFRRRWIAIWNYLSLSAVSKGRHRWPAQSQINFPDTYIKPDESHPKRHTRAIWRDCCRGDWMWVHLRVWNQYFRAQSVSVKGSWTFGVEEQGSETVILKIPSTLLSLPVEWPTFLSMCPQARSPQIFWGALEKSSIIMLLSLYAFGLSKYPAYSPGSIWTTSS